MRASIRGLMQEQPSCLPVSSIKIVAVIHRRTLGSKKTSGKLLVTDATTSL